MQIFNVSPYNCSGLSLVRNNIIIVFDLVSYPQIVSAAWACVDMGYVSRHEVINRLNHKHNMRLCIDKNTFTYSSHKHSDAKLRIFLKRVASIREPNLPASVIDRLHDLGTSATMVNYRVVWNLLFICNLTCYFVSRRLSLQHGHPS